MQPQTFTEGKAQSLAFNEFTYRGYFFDEWNTAPNGDGVAYTDGESISVTRDMTLYAQWKKVIKPVIVTFDANGGSGDMEPQQFIADEARALVANAFTNGNHFFNYWNTEADGSGTTYVNMQTITISQSITLYAQWSVCEYVDLGLQSGTLWANCNVGATSPEDYGDYFAWGETKPKTTYLWRTYKYCRDSYGEKLTKYCYNSIYGFNGYSDDLTTLESCDDAATANCGADWRMPTKEECRELIDNCVIESTTVNGVFGGRFTGPNGNSIFLPNGGYYNEYYYQSVGEGGGLYWSSSLATENHPSCAWHLNSRGGIVESTRESGFSVRPVVAR